MVTEGGSFENMAILNGSGIIPGTLYNTGHFASGNSAGVMTVEGGYTEDEAQTSHPAFSADC